MKKIHLILTIGLTLFLTSAWAEKYEYVRLVIDHESNSTGTYLYANRSITAYDSVELKSGDAAKVIANPQNYLGAIYFFDGKNVFQYPTGHSENIASNIIVGPGLIFIGTNGLPPEHQALSVTLAIERASDSGSTTLAWSGTEWTNPNSSTQVANNNSSGSVQYATLLGWCYFTDTPWLYSYTNGSWYYMKSINNEVYVWNANLPDGGWTKFRG